MISATSASELRNSWEAFLASFSRAIGRLISFSSDDPGSRVWSHRLKNASNKDDPGLLFLRVARNTVEHGLEAFAEFRSPAVVVGGTSIAVEGNGSFSFVGNFVNGRPMGDFRLETSAGKVASLEGQPRVPIYEVPAHVVLKPVMNEDKKIVVPVPKSLMGRAIESEKPVDLASEATAYLNLCWVELRKAWAQ